MSLLLRLRTPTRLLLGSTRLISTSSATRTAIAARRVAGIRLPLPAPSVRAFSGSAAAAVRPPLLDDIPETQQPASFSEIESKVDERTYQALTRGPFNYSEMSSVQAAVLPMLPNIAKPYSPPTAGHQKPIRDLLVKAKTGTGKTIAFLVPAVEGRAAVLREVAAKAAADAGLKESSVGGRAADAWARQNAGILIISPTRELAIQIANEATKLTQHHRYGVHLWVGGESKRDQLRDFERYRKDIIVATPGRLNDILESEPNVEQTFSKINTLVLDEADTLLDMGFRADIERALEKLPESPRRQTFLFSATVSPAIRQIARKSLDDNHAFIDCVAEDDSPVHAHIPQHATIVEPEEHLSHITTLIAHDQLQNPGKSKVILFLNTTKHTMFVTDLTRELRKQLPAGRTNLYELHSQIAQNKRRRTSDEFRADNSGASILVTSDVSARGVDYPNVTRVIQVGIPPSPEQYVHRVGRTGRGNNASGRGDLILLPFEKDYAKRFLDNVPIKHIDHATVQKEVLQLAEKHDSDPAAFFKDVTMSTPRARGRYSSLQDDRPFFVRDVAQRVARIDTAATEKLQELEPRAVSEVASSLVGAYVSAAGTYGMTSWDMYQGLMKSCEGMFGIPPPTFSKDRLAKLGIKDMDGQRRFGSRDRRATSPSFRGRDNRFSKSGGRDREWENGPRWSQRTNQGFRGPSQRSFDDFIPSRFRSKGSRDDF